MTRAAFGVNVFGYVHAESGVGEHTRLLVAALGAAGVPHAVVPLRGSGGRELAEFAESAPGDPAYPVHLVSVNADRIEAFYRDRGPQLFADRYTIGLWAWEVEEFPEWLAEKARYVDEIWANSTFSAKAIAARVDRPVFAFPLPVAEPTAPLASRADLDLTDDYLILFSFDFDSVAARKNPVAAVRAFRRAFAPDEGPRLLIKSVNAERHQRDFSELRQAAAGRADIEIRDGYLSSSDQRSLIGACDLYLSLHRAEGFGLTLAEALALGKPVVATGYSGNLDFMDDTTADLVPFRLVEIGPGRDPYPVFGRWAEPDIESAAVALRSAWSNPEAARMRGSRARSAILRDHGLASRAAFLRQRVGAIEAVASDSWRRSPPSVTAEQYAEALLRHGPPVPVVGRWERRWKGWLDRLLGPERSHRREIDRALLAHPRQVAAEIARIVARRERADLDRWVTELTARVERLEATAGRSPDERASPRP